MYLFCFLKCPSSDLNDHRVFLLFPRYLLASFSCSYSFALGLGGPFSTFSDVFLHIWNFIFPFITAHAISLGHALALPTYHLPVFVIGPDNQTLANYRPPPTHRLYTQSGTDPPPVASLIAFPTP